MRMIGKPLKGGKESVTQFLSLRVFSQPLLHLFFPFPFKAFSRVHRTRRHSISRNIYHLLANATSSQPIVLPTPSDPPPFSPSKSAVLVNALWFLSISMSLTGALLAVFIQQWSLSYLRATARGTTLSTRPSSNSYLPRRGTRQAVPAPDNPSSAHTYPSLPFPLLFRSPGVLVQRQPHSLQRRNHVARPLRGWVCLHHTHADLLP
ncbi:hypothetical protein F5888DRAFT_671849 [Russula emetica]|nr:hypothetical protein F5888DRAFT_671849 [Russula emetica]